MNHGPLTRTKGKLGGVVFQQYEGMQIAREYQPNVKNPQSEKQVENRAKFKLSSQIVAQFAPVLTARLGKLSIYTRTKRAAAVNALYHIINTSEPLTPQVLVSSAVAAINSKSVSALLAPSLSDLQNEDIHLTADAEDIVIYTKVEYDNKGDVYTSATERYTSTGAAVTIAGPDAGHSMVVMAVALRPTTEDGRAAISNMSAMSDGWQNEISRSINAGDLEISNLAGRAYIAS